MQGQAAIKAEQFRGSDVTTRKMLNSTSFKVKGEFITGRMYIKMDCMLAPQK